MVTSSALSLNATASMLVLSWELGSQSQVPAPSFLLCSSSLPPTRLTARRQQSIGPRSTASLKLAMTVLPASAIDTRRVPDPSFSTRTAGFLTRARRPPPAARHALLISSPAFHHRTHAFHRRAYVSPSSPSSRIFISTIAAHLCAHASPPSHRRTCTRAPLGRHSWSAAEHAQRSQALCSFLTSVLPIPLPQVTVPSMTS